MVSDATVSPLLVTAGFAHSPTTQEFSAVEEMCSICQSSIESSVPRKNCNRCGQPFHEECWEANLGCSTYGCSNVDVLKHSGPDIVLGPLPNRSDGPPPLPTRSNSAHPAWSESSAFPWDYLLLAGSSLSLLLSVMMFGVPSLLMGFLNTAYMAYTFQGQPSKLTIISLVITVFGFFMGSFLSWQIYGL